MPPFHSRSTGARRIAGISSLGVSRSASTSKRLADLLGQRDRLRGAREDPAALGDQRRVVVGPRRARQLEQPPRARRSEDSASGFGSRKTWRWSKAATSRMCSRQQHAVAEHVAAHVADADDGEVLGLDVDAELAEVALDGHPRATAR